MTTDVLFIIRTDNKYKIVDELVIVVKIKSDM